MNWKRCFESHGKALLLLARQWVPSHADAEDAVQEAFVRFWRKRSAVRTTLPYLYACVRRAALDWQRRESRQAQRDWIAGVVRAHETMFEDRLDQAERCEAVEVAMNELPVEQREVLVMKLWGDLTFVQTAEALAISPNTAASRYRYALKALRGKLKECWR